MTRSNRRWGPYPIPITRTPAPGLPTPRFPTPTGRTPQRAGEKTGGLRMAPVVPPPSRIDHVIGTHMGGSYRSTAAAFLPVSSGLALESDPAPLISPNNPNPRPKTIGGRFRSWTDPTGDCLGRDVPLGDISAGGKTLATEKRRGVSYFPARQSRSTARPVLDIPRG